MIDFNIDGPCGDDANGRTPLRVLGIGQTGISTLDQLVLHGHNQFDLWALDTDMQTLDGSVVREKMLLGRETLHGMGSSGEVEMARECLIENVEELKLAATGCKHVVIIAGLGGGTGAALAPHLVEQAVEDGARVVVIAATPFSFESRRRHDQAERALCRMRSNADAVLVFGNDQLMDLDAAKVNLRHAFPHIDRLMSSCLDALGQMMVSDGLINLSFADMRSLFGRFSGTEVIENCWAGYGDVLAKDGAEMLVDEILASAFIPEDVLDHADNAMLCLTGGEDLSLQDVQGVLAELKSRLPEDFPVAANANMHEDCRGRLRAALILSTTRVTVEDAPAVEAEVPGDELPFSEPAVDIQPATETPVPVVSGHTQPISLPPIYEEAEVPTEELAEVFAHDSLVAGDEDEVETQPESLEDDFSEAFDAEEEEWIGEENGQPLEASSLIGPPKVSPLLDAIEAREEAEEETPALPPVLPKKAPVPVAEDLPPALPKKQVAEPVSELPPALPKKKVVQPVAEMPPALPKQKQPEPELAPVAAAPEVDEPVELPAIKDQLPIKHEPVILPGFNPNGSNGRQGELQLDQVNRGRFEKTQETIHNGENLDQPTFRRRGMALRL